MAVIIAMEVILGAAAALVLVFATVLFVEVASAIVLPEWDAAEEGERGSVAVLMPAHNESRLIAETIRSVAPQLRSGDRLIVVADNCSDNTAAIAAAEGAEVVIRNDSVRRGKGYALDRGVLQIDLLGREPLGETQGSHRPREVFTHATQQHRHPMFLRLLQEMMEMLHADHVGIARPLHAQHARTS